ncbi:MAG: aspartate aminotransferase family protein [Sphingomonas bacterium]|uniref:aminotransferase class III-fold pyridoxal phosphate-dependent enzyme n=1 Tax=Sphingomonas bacterium TaxID=1895847 RepID=UPI0026246C7A|nr:aminotransferase class III-fold pyridoxal phosphate-dependent enzyme [Sphingomonas bacterium]MDB5707202.1 aspartate aminotransferase family protein [Sphingomonas bacterium]
MLATDATLPNSLDAFWMPFTAHRAFRQARRMFVGAEGMYYRTDDGQKIMDGIAGLWCVNAGHGQPRIVEAIQQQAARLDFVSSFTMSHPAAFELASRLTAAAPDGIDHVFFTNSGSESVDTALKIARGYHRARGQAGRTKFIGRYKSYHGVNFGGLSVGGIARHKLDFGPLLPDVDHLSLPYDPKVSGFSQGQPAAGADYAEELARLIALHDPSTIAAVIVEPVTGSGGVYPPPIGYLDRLRALCTEHGILLIFDEVITGFGRTGPMFASQRLEVTPDLIACAKGMTNGAVPMGGVLASGAVFDAYMTRPSEQIELAHGYTYSAHPLGCAAALAVLDIYQDGLLDQGAAVMPAWQELLHSLRGTKHVADIRTFGLLAGIDLAPRDGAPGARGAALNQACFEAGVLIRTAGDTVMLSPPLVISRGEIETLVGTIGDALARVD